MKKIFGLVFFLAGGAAGFFAGQAYLNDKYQKLAQQEIDAVKLYYKKKQEAGPADLKSKEPEAPLSTEGYPPPTPVGHTPYTSSKSIDPRRMVEELGYTSSLQEKPHPVKANNKPYVIPPNDYGHKDGFDIVSWTYYADGVLADDAEEPLERADIEKSVGPDFAAHFGEYEADSVYIRNPLKQTDYEILRDNRTFKEVVGE